MARQKRRLRGRPGCLLSRFLFGCFGLGVFLVVCSGLALTGAWQTRSSAPQTWDNVVASALGIDSREYEESETTLTEADTAAVTAQGLDPNSVALAIEASDRIAQTYKVKIGPGIILAIFQGETGQGKNVGSCSAKTGALGHAKLSATEETNALNWLLNHWKSLGLRGKDAMAAQYIREDYSDATAHCGADAMGLVGFIASTGKRVCEQFLIPSKDETLATCNWWNKKVAFNAAAYYLYQIGYRQDSDLATQTAKLWGWNQQTDYDRQLAENAKKINELGLNYEVRVKSGFGNMADHESFRDDLAAFLNLLGLLPRRVYSDRESVVSSLPVTLTIGVKDITVNLSTEVPVADGESYNVALWAKSNPVIEIRPGETWSFCTATDQTGWSQYKFAAGFNAGGICINSSMLVQWVKATPGLELAEVYPHQFVPAYPRFTHAVLCPGSDLKIRNSSKETIVGEWLHSGNTLVLRTRVTPAAEGKR